MKLDQPTLSFDGAISTRVVFGRDSITQVGRIARDLRAMNVLLVTDAGVVRAGHAARVRGILEKEGLLVTTYADVAENPTTQAVERCVAVARQGGVDLLIGLGGGSSMDVAKGCNFLLTNGGRMEDYWGYGKATKPMLPLIAVPTTAGTGSECQAYALIAHETSHRKMACGDPKAAARVAILDPVLTLTQPRTVAAATGVDALAHAVETAVTKKRNPLSARLSREAYRLGIEHLPIVLQQPEDLDARAAMQLSAAYAGAAIENSMLGAAHSAANPLTARFNLVHGRAVGLMLPHIVRFNAQDAAVAAHYAEIEPGGADVICARLDEVLRIAGLPRTLREAGVPADALPSLAEAAVQEWTARFNPRDVVAADFVRLYEAAY